MGTGSFLGVKSGRGVKLTPYPLLVPWTRKSRAIPLLPLWTLRPVQNLISCTRVHFTWFYHRRTDGEPVRTQKWSVECETKSGEILSGWAAVSFLKKDFAAWNELFEVMLIDNSHFVWISEKWKITFAPFMLRYLCLKCNMFTLTHMLVSTCNYVCLRKSVAMHSYGYEKIMDHCKRKRQEKEEKIEERRNIVHWSAESG